MELPPRSIHSEVVRNLNDEERMSMPYYDAFRRVVHRQRELPEKKLVNIMDLGELNITVNT
jgi:hypothetical protein